MDQDTASFPLQLLDLPVHFLQFLDDLSLHFLQVLLLWRVQLAVGLQKTPGVVHSPENAAQAAAHGGAGSDTAVDASRIEVGVLARLAPTDHLIGPTHQFDRVVGLEALLKVARVLAHRGPLIVIIPYIGAISTVASFAPTVLTW